MGAIPARNEINGDAFDYSDNGSVISFQESWKQFNMNYSSDFVDIPATAILAAMLVMFIFHIFASSYILKLNSKSLSNWVTKGFYTLISPPLNYDWNFFYKQSDYEETILKCWKRQWHNLACNYVALKSNIFQIKDSFPHSYSHRKHGTSYILYSFACPQNIDLQGNSICFTSL